MAVTLGDAILYLKGDDSGLGETLNSAKSKVGGWAGNVGSVVGGLATGAILGGVTLAAGAIVGLGAATFDLAGDVNAAQNQIQASLGVTEERAKQLTDVAADSFANNWGGSIEEVAGYLAETEKAMASMGGVSDEEMQKIVEGGYALADVFETEISGPEGTINGARVLMEKFGLDADGAMDLMTAGMQEIPADDLLASLTEYGPLMSDLGLSADEMFSLFSSGAEAGVLGTDKIGDAMKEFGIIVNEGGDDAAAALDELGINYDEVAAQVQAGETTWGDQFGAILGGLQDIEDPLHRNRLQTALFGTAAEDLGVNFTDGLTIAKDSLQEVDGATESLNAKYNDFGSLFEGMKRQAMVGLKPLADKLLEIGNKVMPIVGEAFGSMMEAAGPIIEQLADGFDQLVTDLMAWFVPFFSETLLPAFQAIGDWLINEGWPAFQQFIQPVLDQVIPGLQQLAAWALQLAQFAWPLLQMAIQFVMDNMNIIVPIIAAVGLAIGLLSSPIALVVGALLLFATAWANNWGGIQEKTQAFWDWIQPYIQVATEFISTLINDTLAWIQQWWTENGDSVMAKVAETWETIKTAVSQALAFIWETIQAVVVRVQEFWEVWGETIKTATFLMWDNIKTVIKAATDTLWFVIQAIVALINGDWEAFGEALQSIWRTAWNAIETLIGNTKTAIMAIVSKLAELAVKQITAMKDSAIEQVVALKDGFVEKFSEIAGALDMSAIVDVGKDFVDGLWEGIDANWSWFIGKITGVAQEIINTVTGILGIESPSTVGKWIGRMLPAGLAEGIEQMAYAPIEAVSRMSRGLVDQVQAGINVAGLAASGNTTNNVALNYYGPAPGDPARDLRFVQATLGATP